MRLSRFTNIICNENAYLMHNCMYNTIIKIYNHDLMKFIDNIKNNDVFVMNKQNSFQTTLQTLNMIVEDAEDEITVLNSRFFHFEHNSELHIMLIVTRRCNFRCTYCYEEYKDVDMLKEVFDNTHRFIVKKIKEGNYRNVYISFFGGEPTLMASDIVRFMKDLLESNSSLNKPANILAIMTTNGYLLNSKMLNEFIKCNIVRYQITIDGMKEQHNHSRYLANGCGTWDEIIKNVKYFNEIDDPRVAVLLRSNITPEIYSNIEEWLRYLGDNLQKPVYRIHFEIAKNYGKMNDSNFDLLEDDYKIIIDIIEKAKKYDLPLEILGFNTFPFSMVCYAARQFSFIIDYDGTVKKCTSTSLDEPYNCVGTLNENGLYLDEEKCAQWTSYDLGDECKKCNILPLCYGRKCPAARWRYDQCDLLKESYKKGLEYIYMRD